MTVLDVYLMPDIRDISRLLEHLRNGYTNIVEAYTWAIVRDGQAPTGFQLHEIYSFAERQAILVDTGKKAR